MATILAADDSASMRQMVSFTLKGAGYTVIEACDGQDALDKAKQGGVDLVLSDVNMAGMNGYEFLSELKKRYSSSDFPCFIFVSAQVESDDVSFFTSPQLSVPPAFRVKT